MFNQYSPSLFAASLAILFAALNSEVIQPEAEMITCHCDIVRQRQAANLNGWLKKYEETLEDYKQTLVEVELAFWQPLRSRPFCSSNRTCQIYRSFYGEIEGKCCSHLENGYAVSFCDYVSVESPVEVPGVFYCSENECNTLKFEDQHRATFSLWIESLASDGTRANSGIALYTTLLAVLVALAL